MWTDRPTIFISKSKLKVVETETFWDPEFASCWDWDSLRLENLGLSRPRPTRLSKSCRYRDFFESLANPCFESYTVKCAQRSSRGVKRSYHHPVVVSKPTLYRHQAKLEQFVFVIPYRGLLKIHLVFHLTLTVEVCFKY